MRAIGMAERALFLLTDRAKSREAFGEPLIEQRVVQDLIARSRIEIEQARLLVLKTAWLIDHHGAKGARTEIAAIKVAASAVATAVIDRAIEVFGAAGVSDDFPLAYFYARARVPRIIDGPDAVHRRSSPARRSSGPVPSRRPSQHRSAKGPAMPEAVIVATACSPIGKRWHSTPSRPARGTCASLPESRRSATSPGAATARCVALTSILSSLRLTTKFPG
jgi:hypothetical protein